MSLDLSIIIPVFNVEDWIAECLDSLLPLDTSKIEIILVNDGSSDASVEIAKRYEAKFSHFRIFDQENQGLSAARNSGLSLAKGQYIFFLDSDDFVDAKELEAFYQKAIEANVDIAVGNGCRLTESGVTKGLKKVVKENSLAPLDGPSYYFNGYKHDGFHISACVKVYSRKFLIENHLSFLVGVIHEDEEFAPRAFCFAKKALYIDKYFYMHRYRIGSITKSEKHKYLNLKSIPSFNRIIQSFIDFKNKNALTPDQNKVIVHGIHKCAMEIFRRDLYFSKNNLTERRLSLDDKKKLMATLKDAGISFSQLMDIWRMRLKANWASKTK